MKVSSHTKIHPLFILRPAPLIARRFLAASLVLASMFQVSAQNAVFTGTILGRVTDPSGAGVPGASVVVRNLATGIQQSAVTDHAGLYTFLALMPGTYLVTTTVKGFHDIEALVRVRVGNTTLQDLRLKVGGSSDATKVTGTMQLLRPADSG